MQIQSKLEAVYKDHAVSMTGYLILCWAINFLILAQAFRPDQLNHVVIALFFGTGVIVLPAAIAYQFGAEQPQLHKAMLAIQLAASVVSSALAIATDNFGVFWPLFVAQLLTTILSLHYMRMDGQTVELEKSKHHHAGQSLRIVEQYDKWEALTKTLTAATESIFKLLQDGKLEKAWEAVIAAQHSIDNIDELAGESTRVLAEIFHAQIKDHPELAEEHLGEFLHMSEVLRRYKSQAEAYGNLLYRVFKLIQSGEAEQAKTAILEDQRFNPWRNQ